jgi:tetratricopeptide (TPR) repeat protein
VNSFSDAGSLLPPRHFNSTWLAVAILLLALFNPAAGRGAETAQQSTPSQNSSGVAGERKTAGDVYLKNDDLENAADAYISALDLARGSFSVAERVQMATALSWADRLARAEHELRSVLAIEPDNLEARIRLARVLSWRGEVTDAVSEADRALRQAPEDRAALQIKADALQWKGELGRALPLYEELVKRQDDFDARLGLSYSLLYAGNRMAAEESSRRLAPTTTNQQSRFSKFQDTFDGITRPRLDLQYSYFNDSDGNVLNRYGAAQSFWIDNFDFALKYRHTEAKNDDNRRNRGEDISFKAYTKPTESYGLGASVGFTQLAARGGVSNFPNGQIRFDVKVPNGSVGGSLTREVLTESAELIDNRIRTTVANLQWSQQLTDRFSVQPAYSYLSFSDVNHAHVAQFTSQYLLFFNPKLAIGHRFAYKNFDRQSHSGYFDPNDYYSNRFFVTFYKEQDRFYLFSDTFVGQQAFRRNGIASKDLVYGGSGSIGYRPFRNVVLEFSVEGGQVASAAASSSGYAYLVLGPRLWIRF